MANIKKVFEALLTEVSKGCCGSFKVDIEYYATEVENDVPYILHITKIIGSGK